MYRDFYGLQVDPFGLDPNLDFLFISRAHEEAVSHIAYGLEQQEAIILITGDIGTGKTVALQRVVAQVSGTFVPIVINVTTIDFLQFMRLVMYKLGEKEPAPDISGLLHTFESKLKEAQGRGQKLLLVVDEAQNCSPSLLESIRLLLNLAQPGGQVLQLVLAGQIGLEDVLAHADLRQFRQRIRVSYRLECLNRAETEAYVVHRLKVAGREARLFDAGALDRIFQLSGGVPRLVNQVADRALLAGFVENSKQIRAAHVEEAGIAVEGGVAEVRRSPNGESPVPPVQSVPQPAPPIRRVTPGTDQAFAERRGGRSRGRRWLIAAILVVIASAAIFTVTRLGPLRGDMTARKVTPAGPEVSRELESPAAVSALLASSDSAGFRAEPADTVTIVGPALPESAVVIDTTIQLAANAQTLSEVIAIAPEQPHEAAKAAEAPAASHAPHAEGIELPDGPVSVHVFSFRTPDRAENSRGGLERANIPTFIHKEQGANGVAWYRVYIGPLATRARAVVLIDSLRSVGAIEYASITSKAPERP